MASLMITDIRKSCCDRGFDLVTAIFLCKEDYDAIGSKTLDKKSLLVLESSTADEEIPAIGVCCGDQYIRMRAKQDHGMIVGEKIRLDSI